MSVTNEYDLAELLKQKLEEALKQRGKVNILIAGKVRSSTQSFKVIWRKQGMGALLPRQPEKSKRKGFPSAYSILAGWK